MDDDLELARRGVSLHVGHLKTGTTSLQAVLYGSRAALASRGVKYEPSVGRYHTREAFDLLERDPVFVSRRSPTLEHTMMVALAGGRGQWDVFAAAARRAGARTLLSAESLSFGSRATADMARADLGDLPLRVVITTRPLSQRLVSQYAQWARKRALPPVDDVMRIVLRSLICGHDDGPFAGLLTEHLRRIWEPVADDLVEIVRFDAADMPGYQRRFWAAMGIPGNAPIDVPRENESLPAGALVAWQEHLRASGRYDHRVDGGTLARVLTASANPDRSTLTLRLRPHVARVVDAALPVMPGDDGGSPADVSRLRDLVESGEPLTEYASRGNGEVDADRELQMEIMEWKRTFSRTRRVVGLRIGLARALGLRRDPSDWDRFRRDDPDAVESMTDIAGGL